MLFVSIFIAIALVYFAEMYIYNKYSFNDLEYKVTVSAEEVFEGEDIFMYEEISNNKNLPIPNAKVDTELPDGLCFRLSDRRAGKKRGDVFQKGIQSIFVLRGNQKIRRRWRVNCNKRGIYTLGNVMIITNDLIGLNAQSKRFRAENGKFNQVVVLPKAIILEDHFVSSYMQNGEVIVPRSLVTDPLYIAGSREYTPLDPMNRINWKSTAAHNKLMVNNEEYTERNQFNIVLNMQSRDREKDADEPSNPEYIELCITVCASIFDRMSQNNVPIRMLTNTPPESIGEEGNRANADMLSAVSDDEIGKKILVTRVFRGKGDTIDALRTLAALQMKISCPIENMLDHIINNPSYYANGGNIIMVTSFINERMIIFHDALMKQGVKVVFYVTTANQNALVIPDNIEVYYKTHV